jgi:hypothetical protein
LFLVAVTVTKTGAGTEKWSIPNVTILVPATIVTTAGTTIDGSELAKATSVSTATTPAKVSVPVSGSAEFPLMDATDVVNDVIVIGLTVVFANTVFVPREPETDVGVDATTSELVMVKVAEPRPAAMNTVGGTKMASSFGVSATFTPPAGAGMFNLTVPVLAWLPSMEVGMAIDFTPSCAKIVRVAVVG